MKPNSKNHIAASFPTRLILSFGLAVTGLGFQSAHAATWSGGGADAKWSTALNWDVALANSFSTSLVFAGSTQTTNTNDLTGGTAASITFNSGAGAFVLGGTAITLGGNITNGSTSLQTINLPMTTTVSNTVTTAASGGDITLGGVIGGNGNISKAGSGTLLISGANTYTGNTIVSAGTLKNGSATTFTTKGALILNGTGTFDLNGFSASFNNEGGSVAANTITNTGAADATLTITGTNSGNFAGQFSDGTKKLGVAMSNNNSFGIFLSNTGNTFSGGLTLLNQGPNGTRLSITQAIVTTGSPGAITSSTYGAGPITIGQIATDRAGILINVATTLPNAIVFNTALGNDNPGIRLEANGIVLSGAITANSNAAFSGAGASATVSGAISGTGGLTSTNTGVLTLSGANTYTGNTSISAGTLKNGSAITFTNKGSLTMNGTGTLDLNGFNASFKEFGSGSVAGNTITNSGASDATLALATESFNNTLAALIKDGTTKKLALTFSNNNQFVNFLTNSVNTFSGGLTLLNHTGGLGGTRLAILSPIVTTGSPGAITSSTFGTGPITIGLTSTDRAGILFSGTNNNTLANAIVFNTALGSDQSGIRFGTTGNVLSGAITANSDAAFSGPSPGSATVSGVISGVGGVSTAEGVALTLTGVNTFAGNATITGGNLQIGGAGQLGSGSYAGNIANSGTFTFASSAVQSLSGVISGSGALVANGGAGNTLTIAGTNTYAGSTTISSGSLRIGAGSTTGSIDPASAITDDANLTINRSDSVTQGVHFGTISGTGSFTQAGSGVTTLNSANTYAGGTFVSGGTLLIPGTGSVTSVDVSAAAIMGIRSEGAGQTLTTPGVTFAASKFLADFNNLVNPSAPLLTTDMLTLNGNVVVSAANLGLLTNGSFTLIHYTTKSGPGTVSLISPTIGTRSSGTLSDNGTDIVLSVVTDKPKWTGLASAVWSTAAIGSPKNWILNTAGTTTDYIQGDDVLFDDTATGNRTINIASASVLPASTVFTTTASNYILASSGGFGIGGSGALVKNNSGTVVITTGNVYTGSTTINGGTLQLGDGTTDGSIAGSSAIINNGTLAYDNLTDKTAAVAISGTGGIIKSGPGGLALSGINSYEGDTTLNGGLLTLGSTTALGIFGTLTINGGSLDSSVTNLALTNNNPQNWNADINFQGTNSLNLGSGSVILGGNRQINVAANTLTVGGSIDGAGFALTKIGAGLLVLGGYNFYDGGTTLAAGTVRITNGSALGTSGNIDFSGGILQYGVGITTDYSPQIAVGTSPGPVAIQLNGQTLTFFTALTASQSGGLTLLGLSNSGILRLNAPNAYLGETLINIGTLQIGASEVIPDGSVVRMTGGVTNAPSTKLEIQNNTETIAGLSGDGIVQGKEAGPAPVGTGTLVIDTAGQSYTFNGLIRNAAGNLAIVKTGLGTQTIVNTSILNNVNNDFSGGLTVNGGTLKLRDAGNNNHVVSGLRSDVTIAAGATLAMENTVVANTSTVIKVIGGAGSVEISAGNLGIINLTGVNTYTGNTNVASGTLIVSGNSATTFADTSTVTIASGAVLNLPNAATDTVASLVVNGTALPAGIYDSTSPATTGFITGSGKIQIVSAGYSSWAATHVGGALANIDTDLDGVQNGVEYFMNSAAGFTANPALMTVAGVSSITWPNGGNIPFGDYGSQFVVQTSPDLSTWTNIPSGDPNLNNTSGSLIYTLPTGAGKSFVRLNVTPN